MRIVCVGGGPAGLYFGLLMKKENPAHRVAVVERNRPYDTFGWGVVFSDATMDNMRAWDAATADEQDFEARHDDQSITAGRTGRAARFVPSLRAIPPNSLPSAECDSRYCYDHPR